MIFCMPLRDFIVVHMHWPLSFPFKGTLEQIFRQWTIFWLVLSWVPLVRGVIDGAHHWSEVILKPTTNVYRPLNCLTNMHRGNILNTKLLNATILILISGKVPNLVLILLKGRCHEILSSINSPEDLDSRAEAVSHMASNSTINSIRKPTL
jgi:hypothetical protein